MYVATRSCACVFVCGVEECGVGWSGESGNNCDCVSRSELTIHLYGISTGTGHKPLE